jgi:cytochrome c553
MRVLVVLCLVLSPALARADDAAMARAEKVVAGSCFLCHGMQGESATELFPRLAAQNAAYIAKQLANFKSGERKSEVMPRMVGALTPEDMSALGLYFSRQRSAPHSPADAALAARGRTIYEKGGAATEVAACVGCHGDRGHGAENLPRLAGQVPTYLAAQIRNFGARVRTNDNAVMHTIAAKMTEQEIRAVAEYLSGLD